MVFEGAGGSSKGKRESRTVRGASGRQYQTKTKAAARFIRSNRTNY